MRVKFNLNDKKFNVGDIVYCYNKPTTWATHPNGGYFARVTDVTELYSTFFDVCIDKETLLSQCGYWPTHDIIVKVEHISYHKGDLVNYDGKVFTVQNKDTQDNIRIRSLDSEIELTIPFIDVLPLPNTNYKNKLKKELNLKV